MPSLKDREKAFTEGPTKAVPFDVWPEDIDFMPPFPFPALTPEQVEGTKTEGFHLERIIKVDWNKPGIDELIRQLKVARCYAFLIRGNQPVTVGEFTVRRGG